MVVDHGTMCAYAVCIASPRCTLLDVAVLRPATLEALLSDALRAYAHLLSFMRSSLANGKTRSLVVNNSWGVYNLDSDFPPGDPGNYTENPAHPFNVIVASLERAGADIVFAAGNCGRDCPDNRCSGVTRMIHGANAHAQTLCVAGVDVDKVRVGYSSIGPGRLERLKPDLAGYTHFAGSRVFAPGADSGTSTAAPVVAGVVAAIRSKFPRDPAQPATSPAALRALLTKTAEDRGTVGFDFRYGWGIVNGCRLAALQSLAVSEPPDA
jgi:subtilisin family serine protease